MSKFKLGDRVKAVRTDMLWDRMLNKEGVVVGNRDTNGVDPTDRPRVRFDNGEEDFGCDSDLELVTPATPRGEFKVGDRVRINKGHYRGGEEGTVIAVRENSEYGIDLAHLRPGTNTQTGETTLYRITSLELATDTSTTSLNGKNYTVRVNADGTITLTPAVEKGPEPEPKREPRQGEVWKRDKTDDLLLRVRQDTEVKWIALRDARDGTGYTWVTNPPVTFAYESLAAAAKDGALG